MLNANAPAPAPSIEGVTTLVGGGVVEGVAPAPAPSAEGVITLVGVDVGGGVIVNYEPSQEKSQAKADQKKSKKGYKYLLSVLGQRLKKLKPFKLTWTILRWIGKPIHVVVTSVKRIINTLLLIVVTMSKANAVESVIALVGTGAVVEGITALVGTGDVVEGVAPAPPLVEGRTTLVGGGSVISVLGRHWKKLKPFKRTWKTLRGIGENISVRVRNISWNLYIMVFWIIFGTVIIIIFGIPLGIATAYVLCRCPFL